MSDIEHRQGCPALPGYGHAPEPCTCGAMTAETDLLPSSVAAFTEALKGGRGSLDAWLEVNNEREVAAHIEAYARAHATAAKDAEIEALRTRLEDAVRDGLNEHCRAERLAEALRRYRNEVPLGHQPHMLAHEVDALLNPTAARENDACHHINTVRGEDGVRWCQHCRQQLGQENDDA